MIGFKKIRLRLAIAGVGFCAAAFCAAGPPPPLFWDFCYDPTIMCPVSTDASATDPDALSNGILSATLGLGGTVNYGNSPCGIPYSDMSSHQVAGGIGLMTFNGSALSSDDDLCALVGGLSLNTDAPECPPPPVGIVPSNRLSYVTIRSVDAMGMATDSKWGEGGFRILVAPNASFRRLTAIDTVEGGIDAQLILNDVGPALRFEWTLTNLNATQRSVGLRYTGMIAMRMQQDVALLAVGKTPFVVLPSGRPQIVQQEFNRATLQNFPQVVDFYWAQSYNYPSLRFRMDRDNQHPDQTRVDRFALGGIVSPWSQDSRWDFPLLPDANMNYQFAMWFDPVAVPPGQSRRIVFYVEPSWSFSDLKLPYMTASEAPQLISYDGAGTNGLSPNPFPIVTYVDNQYARQNQSLTIADVEATLNLPPGLSLAVGETATKSTGPIAPNQMAQVQWMVQSDGIHVNKQAYSIRYVPRDTSGNILGGPNNIKTLQASTVIALTPNVDLDAGANLVTFPWQYADSNFTALGFGGATAFNWNATSQSYEIATDAERGRGQWLIYGSNPPPISQPGASSPGDKTTGDYQIDLKHGWNLIGNPYEYPIQLNQLIGINGADPSQTFRWTEITAHNWIRSTIVRWDSAIQDYVYNSDDKQLIPAGAGFWIYVNTFDTMQLSWPPVFLPGLAGSFLSDTISNNGLWRVNLSASMGSAHDVSSSFGQAGTTAEADRLSSPKAPAKPYSRIQLSLQRGNGVNWAQDVRMRNRLVVYNAEVRTTQGGTVRLDWPSVQSVPNNVTLRIKDLTTGLTRDMRANTSYTFGMNSTGVRRFTITAVTR